MTRGRKRYDQEVRRLSRKFPSFLGVGAIGFLVDATVFFGLSMLADMLYGWARIAASLVALTATWMLNRSSTFAAGRIDTSSVEFLRYLAASSVGALSNLAVLSLIAPFDGALLHFPAYVGGALIGLIVNFLLYDKFVFHGRAQAAPSASTPSEDTA